MIALRGAAFRRSIPEGRITITQGAHIGNVEQVITDHQSDHVTYFVVGEGVLLKEHKLIQAFWVSNVDDGKIHWSVQAGVFKRLSDYQPD